MPEKRLADHAAFVLGQNSRACLVRVRKCLMVVRQPAAAALYHISDDTGRDLVVWFLHAFSVPNAQFEKLKAHADAGGTSIVPQNDPSIDPTQTFLQLLTPNPSAMALAL